MSVDRHQATRILWEAARDENRTEEERIESCRDILRAHERSEGFAIPSDIEIQAVRRLCRKLQGTGNRRR